MCRTSVLHPALSGPVSPSASVWNTIVMCMEEQGKYLIWEDSARVKECYDDLTQRKQKFQYPDHHLGLEPQPMVLASRDQC